MKIIMVEWDDPCSIGPEWEDREVIDDLIATPCVTTGILFRETDSDVRIILTLNPHKFSQAITIPRSCIKRMRTLEVKG